MARALLTELTLLQLIERMQNGRHPVFAVSFLAHPGASGKNYFGTPNMQQPVFSRSTRDPQGQGRESIKILLCNRQRRGLFWVLVAAIHTLYGMKSL